MCNKYDAETARRVLETRIALAQQKIKVPPHMQKYADEIVNAPLTLSGLVDISTISPEAIALARLSPIALGFSFNMKQESSLDRQNLRDSQYELFELFRRLFSSLTGRAYQYISGEGEIKERLKHRVNHETNQFVSDFNKVAGELKEFYRCKGIHFFKHAQKLGGIKLVTGGQRVFGPSALNAVRITGLYADTQLIPDPIFPFLSADLYLNAVHYQLAVELHKILQLKPLVDLDVEVPPVFLFPSFDQTLEENDPYTKYAQEQFFIRMISPICDGTIESMEDMLEYAEKYDDLIAQRILAEKLFIPPGRDVEEIFTPEDAVKIYLEGLEGVRDNNILKTMKAASTGKLLLIGTLERLRPQFHLLENVRELNAQPLLSQPVHWHYFEKCAAVGADELHREDILSERALQTLRAVQDDSLSWLASISVELLAELIKKGEHKWLRSELDEYTKQLAGLELKDINRVVAEVSHGLASLVQKQRQSMREIEKKYEPGKNAALFKMAAGASICASAWFLPAISPLVGALGAYVTLKEGAYEYLQKKIEEGTEKKHLNCSMLGVLATVRPK